MDTSFSKATYLAVPDNDRYPKKYSFTPLKVIGYLLLALATAVSILSFSTDLTAYIPTLRSCSTSMASAQGWHVRANVHPSGSGYEPSRSNLILVLQRLTKVEPEGFTLSLLSPDVAIDSNGRVLQLSSEDWSALEALAVKARDPERVPATGSYRNRWRCVREGIERAPLIRSSFRIQQRRTDLPIDQFWLAKDATGPLHPVGVHGYVDGTTVLSTPVGDIAELPEVSEQSYLNVMES